MRAPKLQGEKRSRAGAGGKARAPWSERIKYCRAGGGCRVAWCLFFFPGGGFKIVCALKVLRKVTIQVASPEVNYKEVLDTIQMEALSVFCCCPTQA